MCNSNKSKFDRYLVLGHTSVCCWFTAGNGAAAMLEQAWKACCVRESFAIRFIS